MISSIGIIFCAVFFQQAVALEVDRPLAVAIANDNKGEVEKILKESKWIPLRWALENAALNDSAEVAVVLCKEGLEGSQIGQSILLAAKHGNLAVLKVLLDKAKEQKLRVFLNVPLTRAAYHGYAVVVEYMLHHAETLKTLDPSFPKKEELKVLLEKVRKPSIKRILEEYLDQKQEGGEEKKEKPFPEHKEIEGKEEKLEMEEKKA